VAHTYRYTNSAHAATLGIAEHEEEEDEEERAT